MIEEITRPAKWRYVLYRTAEAGGGLLLLVLFLLLGYPAILQFPIVLCIVPLSLIGLSRLVFFLIRVSREAQNPAPRIDKSENFDALNAQAEDELSTPPLAVIAMVWLRGQLGQEPGWLAVTNNLIVIHTKRQRRIIPISDVIWIYRQSYSSARGSSSTIRIIDRYGDETFLDGKYRDKRIDATLELFRTKYPWIILGYSKEIATTYRKDRQSLIDKVDREREEVLRARVDDPASPSAAL